MIKRIIQGALRRAGYQIVPYLPEQPRHSQRTSALTYYETPIGKYYLPSDAHGDIVVQAMKAGQIFEQEVVDLARKYIRPGTIAIDVGANFGQMSLLFSDMVGESGKVYSLEADDFVFEVLKKNIEANQKKDRIVTVFGAVHHTAGETLYFPVQDFKRFESYGAYGVDYNASAGRAVKSFTIDSLKIEAPVSFMKIDIQGGDLPAMQGAVETIKRNRMPIIFEYEYRMEEEFKMSFQDYVDFVRGIGYRFDKVINGHNYLIVPV